MTGASGTGNTAPALTSTAALLFIWALLTYIVRVWVKLKKSDSWDADDTTISLALIGALCHIICIFQAVGSGFGVSWSTMDLNDRVAVEKSLYAAQIFYVLSIGLIKLSTSFFNVRLSRDGRNVRIAYALSIVCGVWTLMSVLVVCLRGDLTIPWATEDGTNTMYIRWMILEISGAVLELCLWAASAYFIWRLHMSVMKKIAVSAIFSSRLIILPIAGLRLWQLSPAKDGGLDKPTMMGSVYTEAVLEFAFISASCTCLKPFLRPFHSSYFVSSVGTKGSAIPISSKRKKEYYVLSTTQSGADGTDESVWEDNKEPQQTTSPTKPPLTFRPDKSSYQATALSPSTQEEGDRNTREMVISMKREWDVTHMDDDRAHPL